MKIKSNDNLNLDDLLGNLSNKNTDESKAKKDEEEKRLAEQESRVKALRERELRIQNEKKSQLEKSVPPVNKGTPRTTQPPVNAAGKKQQPPVNAAGQKQQSTINNTADKIKKVVKKETEVIRDNVNKRLSNKVSVNYDVKNTDKERVNLDKIGEINSENGYDRAKLKAAGILVTASFEFAKAQYQRTFAILILLSIITITVVFQTYNIATYKAPVKYIPVYEDKTIIDPLPLDKPVMSDDAMKQWLADSVSEIFSYSYLNVDRHGEKISPFFTEQGYKNFQKEFAASADVNRVRGQSLTVISTVVGSPSNMFDGFKVSGPYAYWDWHLQLRQVFISTNNKFIPVTYDVVATVIRQDQRIYRNGIAIHNLRIVSSSELKAQQGDK